jgi:lycopene cyclase domain-containing protein
MTYAVFLGVFLVVPIAALAWAVRPRWDRRHGLACAMVCALAFLYTAPWDNYAARVGLWSFDAQFAPRSHFIGYLPWEEYAFYGSQGVLVCLGLVWLARVLGPKDGGEL